MIDEAASDPDLIDALSRDLERFMLAASTSLGDPDEGELRLAAARGDWSGVLRTASTALRSRLTAEGSPCASPAYRSSAMGALRTANRTSARSEENTSALQ